MYNMNEIVGSRDILFITLDTLRYDIACREQERGNLPNLCGEERWEKRHSPGSFTFASHQAFFAGFLPTPARPGLHERLFAAKFQGSETTGSNTYCFDSPDIVSGLQKLGYRTACIGGVGFFNRLTPLGSVLPAYFEESYWRTELGVTDPESTKNQVEHCINIVETTPETQRLFLFLNISALHQPNWFYLEGACREDGDSLESHAAALRYVDRELSPLFDSLKKRGSTFVIACSDHGTAYGEDGFRGHRLAHETVWNIPYREFSL